MNIRPPTRVTFLRQQGYGAIAIIFVVAIAALLVLSAAIALTNRQKAMAQTLDATKMYYLALGGAELGAVRAKAGGCGTVPAVITLEGVEVRLGCTVETVEEGGATYPVYALTATAATGSFSAGTLARRQVRLVVVDR